MESKSLSITKEWTCQELKIKNEMYLMMDQSMCFRDFYSETFYLFHILTSVIYWLTGIYDRNPYTLNRDPLLIGGLQIILISLNNYQCKLI